MNDFIVYWWMAEVTTPVMVSYGIAMYFAGYLFGKREEKNT